MTLSKAAIAEMASQIGPTPLVEKLDPGRVGFALSCHPYPTTFFPPLIAVLEHLFPYLFF